MQSITPTHRSTALALRAPCDPRLLSSRVGVAPQIAPAAHRPACAPAAAVEDLSDRHRHPPAARDALTPPAARPPLTYFRRHPECPTCTCDHDTPQPTPAPPPGPQPTGPQGAGPLFVGDFTLASEPVIDADTLQVRGMRELVRLLHLDSEETFRSSSDRRSAERDWDAYVQDKLREEGPGGKFGTPMGEQAKAWAKEFFRDVERVRLVRDDPHDHEGNYGRTLAYALVDKNGQWVNYNLECVRAGMSPYFMKYGYSSTLHDDFVQAQQQAQAARRGIWDPTTKHYPDYPERMARWQKRAEFMHAFAAEAAQSAATGGPEHIMLNHVNAEARLQANEGRTVVLMGVVERAPAERYASTRMLLKCHGDQDFVVFFPDAAWLRSAGVHQTEGDVVVVEGTLTRHRNQLEISVVDPAQLRLPPGIPPAP